VLFRSKRTTSKLKMRNNDNTGRHLVFINNIVTCLFAFTFHVDCSN